VERLTIWPTASTRRVRNPLTVMESRTSRLIRLADAEEEQILPRLWPLTGGNKSRPRQVLGIERKTL